MLLFWQKMTQTRLVRKEIVDKLLVISFRTRFASFLGGKRGTFRRQEVK